MLKGILTAEDARLGVEHGADAIWVSNHGGRQLDRVAAGVDVLEEVVDAVEGRAEVYLDGGSGAAPDILIALALGARGGVHGAPVPVGARLRRRAGRDARHSTSSARSWSAAWRSMGVATPADLGRGHVEHV